MGTYALGAFMMDKAGGASAGDADDAIRALRNAGKLRALPIVRIDKESGMLVGADGSKLYECGGQGSGRWLRAEELRDGSVCYLGSATHAGHIELKAMWVRVGGLWYNIITCMPEPVA